MAEKSRYFAYFLQKGIFNKDVAQLFRDNILSRGGTEDPMTLYIRFRGQEPSVKALMKRNGIIGDINGEMSNP